MKKRSILLLVGIALCVLAGCEKGQFEISKETNIQEGQTLFQMEIKSSVKMEDCYICGNREDSLMPYYAEKDSIGIVFWNESSICDTDVRVLDDLGETSSGHSASSLKISSFGEGFGSIWVNGMPERGLTRVKVRFKSKDELDFDRVRNRLCQKCLDRVVQFYSEHKNNGHDDRNGITGYCLVDYQTRELYPLSEPYRSYFIRDYYVSLGYPDNETEDQQDILIVYVPER